MNVLCNLSVTAGITTFLWDTAKGYLLAVLGWKWGGMALAVLMSLAAVAGHNWPLREALIGCICHQGEEVIWPSK
ncbi:glycerol-3-phosphate acyltransferase [Neomoorella glycerini]|uniref:glycerol-3-phosphate acyltransferase n=1 Tax=Neomoorella glycerini TaxID=55779 RepID=UPI0012E2C5B0|nr:glycerol-3-phosphate acyltransferase [Moorella glycerini]